MITTLKNLIGKTVVGLSMALALSGCATTTSSVITDYDRDAQFNNYQTFYWSDDFQMENGETKDPIFYNTLIKKRLKKAIKDEMTGRGYQLNAKNPDLLINSDIMVEQKRIRKSSYPAYPYFGYYPGYTSSITTKQKKKGTLIIELIDKERQQLVWQGYAPNVIQTNTEDKLNEIRIAVSKLFAKYDYRVNN